MTKTRTIVLSALIAVIVLAIGVVLFITRDGSSDTPKPSESTSSTASSTTEGGNITPEESTPENPSIPQGTISITLNSPIEDQTFNDIIDVRTVISGATSGTCTVTFSQSGQKDIVKTAPIVQAPTYHTCNGFDIATSEFPARGKWTLQVKATSSDATGTTEKREIVLS